MVKFLDKLKQKINDFISTDEEAKILSETEQDYVELDTEQSVKEKKLLVRTYNITDFTDLKPILDNLREGHTIALINIKALKDKDLVELKRAINKLKKTIDAIEGDIAGFGEDYIVATPAIAKLYRNEEAKKKPKLEEDFE